MLGITQYDRSNDAALPQDQFPVPAVLCFHQPDNFVAFNAVEIAQGEQVDANHLQLRYRYSPFVGLMTAQGMGRSQPQQATAQDHGMLVLGGSLA